MHGRPVVGHPKYLSDLDKIEADVRLVCRRCGFEDDWTVADLTRHLLAIGGSTVSSEVTRYLECRRFGCGSGELRAIPVPFARRPANMPRRIGTLDTKTLATALDILEAAKTEPATRQVATRELRLALLIAYRYAGDRTAVKLFWERASRERPSVNDTLHEPLGAIREALVKRRWIAPEVLLAHQCTWPWSSPAPRGWKTAPDVPVHQNDD